MQDHRLEEDIRWVLRAKVERIDPPPDLVSKILSRIRHPANSTRRTEAAEILPLRREDRSA